MYILYGNFIVNRFTVLPISVHIRVKFKLKVRTLETTSKINV